jgi:alpha-tubulin suppressor-like RCC1 family protein
MTHPFPFRSHTPWLLALALLAGCPSSTRPTAQDAAHEVATEASAEDVPRDVSVPEAPMIQPLRPTPTLGAGQGHTCALHDGSVWCWGETSSVAGLPLGTNTPPVRVAPAVDFVEIWSGANFSCARSAAGGVSCWGGGSTGVLGNGVRSRDTTISIPTRVEGLEEVVALRSGALFACAVRRDGERVLCWGHNALGQVGGMFLNEINDRPAPVPGVEGVVDVYGRSGHTCALHRDGRVTCWGGNTRGQCGRPAARQWVSPAVVPGIDGAIAVVTGGEFSCVVRADHTVACWGGNDWGQLGDGTTVDRLTPAPVPGLRDVVELATGIYASICARLRDGSVWCWGSRGRALVGPPENWTGPQTTPIRVAGLNDAMELSLGGLHACARRRDQTVVCWGDRRRNCLGDGVVSDEPSLEPVEVVFRER